MLQMWRVEDLISQVRDKDAPFSNVRPLSKYSLGVDWVLQLDCPADVDDYIHRVGRTARMNAKGEAALVLTPPQEEGFVSLMEKRQIPIKKIWWVVCLHPFRSWKTIM